MGSCKFKVRKEDYNNTLNTIFKLFPSRDDHIILGDDKYQRWIESLGYIVDLFDKSGDLITSIDYIGCYGSFDNYIDKITDMKDLLYVISKKDLDNILISKEELIDELEINPSGYTSLDDFLENIRNKTGITYRIGCLEKFLPKERLISSILGPILRQVAENRKNEFLFSLPWGGYKRNPRDRHEL